jgi:hypothetical protein
MKKTLRALHDSEYKIIPAEQRRETEKDTFNTYVDNLLPTKPKHLTYIRNTRKDRGF